MDEKVLRAGGCGWFVLFFFVSLSLPSKNPNHETHHPTADIGGGDALRLVCRTVESHAAVTQGGTMTFAGSGDLTLSKDRGTGLYGYLNDLGMWAIPPQYKSASSFNSDGLACVQVGGLFGAIDRLNQFVIQPRFRSWSDIRNAVTSLTSGRYAGIELWAQDDPATGLVGYLNHFGEWAIPPQYETGYDFYDGYAIVSPGQRRWGVIDRMNRFVIQPNFGSSGEARNALNRLKGH